MGGAGGAERLAGASGGVSGLGVGDSGFMGLPFTVRVAASFIRIRAERKLPNSKAVCLHCNDDPQPEFAFNFIHDR